MKNLIQVLRKETESLKTQFVEKRKTYASSYYDLCIRRKTWNEEEWCKYFGLTPRIANPGTKGEFLTYPSNFHNTSNARRLDRIKADIRSILNLSLEKYLKQEELNAITHYENSILKLADRISKKGLNIEKLKTTTSHIGVNIETILTDDMKTVKAFTIVAGGEIQQPHYRYLIK